MEANVQTFWLMLQPKDILKNVNLNKLFPQNSPYFLRVVETISVVTEIPSFIARYFSFFCLYSLEVGAMIPQRYSQLF